MSNYYFFWKDKDFMSNFYKLPTTMKHKGKEFYTSEQAFMWEKAIFFKDFQTADKILNLGNKHPKEAKRLGRQVKNYNDKLWNEVRENIMFEVLMSKFDIKDLKKQLLNTKDLILVEASPFDKIWGIGLDENDAKKIKEENWPGKNLLGNVLMKVRKEKSKSSN